MKDNMKWIIMMMNEWWKDNEIIMINDMIMKQWRENSNEW